MIKINLDRIKEYIEAVESQQYDLAIENFESAFDQLESSKNTVDLVKENLDLREQLQELKELLTAKTESDSDTGNETPTLVQS